MFSNTIFYFCTMENKSSMAAMESLKIMQMWFERDLIPPLRVIFYKVFSNGLNAFLLWVLILHVFIL